MLLLNIKVSSWQKRISGHLCTDDVYQISLVSICNDIMLESYTVTASFPISSKMDFPSASELDNNCYEQYAAGSPDPHEISTKTALGSIPQFSRGSSPDKLPLDKVILPLEDPSPHQIIVSAIIFAQFKLCSEFPCCTSQMCHERFALSYI